MSKEHTTTVEEARLCRAAIDLAKSFVDADIAPEDTRNEMTREVDHQNVNGGCFKAIEEQVETGARDLEGLFRVARKARALKVREEGK